MRLLSLSETSVQPRTSLAKFDMKFGGLENKQPGEVVDLGVPGEDLLDGGARYAKRLLCDGG